MITEIAEHQAAQQPAVTVYTRPSCQQCRATFRWLDKHEITYTEVDISQDLDAREYVVSLDYLQAPVVVTSDGEHWSGFRPDQLEGLL